MVVKSISHRMETMVETIVCWYLQGIIRNQGFLGGAKYMAISQNRHICQGTSKAIYLLLAPASDFARSSDQLGWQRLFRRQRAAALD